MFGNLSFDVNQGTGGMSRFTPPSTPHNRLATPITPSNPELVKPVIGGGLLGSTSTPWYTTDPNFSGIDMSGYVPPRMDTMDIRNYYINGKKYTSGSQKANMLKDYLDSTGQGNFFSWDESTIPNANYGGELAQTTTPSIGQGMIGTPTPPTTNEYGFTRIQGPHAQAVIDYYNPTTGQTFSGTGWNMPENSDWRVGKPSDTWKDSVMPLPDSTPKFGPVPAVDFNTYADGLYADGSFQEKYYGTQPTTPVTTPFAPFNLTPNPDPIWGAPAYYRPEPEAWWQKPIPGFGPQQGGMWGQQQPWWQGLGYQPQPKPTTPTPTPTTPATPVTPIVSDSSGDGDSGASVTDTTPTYQDYADYYGGYGRDIVSLLGSVVGLPLQHLVDYQMGYSPTTGKFYDTFQGPGSSLLESYGIAPSTEQGKLLLEQDFLSDVPPGFLGNIFGLEGEKVVDPDQLFFNSKEAEEAWHGAVSDSDLAEADAINEHGWGSDEHIAAIEQSFENAFNQGPPTTDTGVVHTVVPRDETVVETTDWTGDTSPGVGSQHEADVVDTYGWGSDEHFDAIEESFDAAFSGSDGDDFSEGGNMSDWGSAEEFNDDFGMDGWGDWGEDDDGGFE